MNLLFYSFCWRHIKLKVFIYLNYIKKYIVQYIMFTCSYVALLSNNKLVIFAWLQICLKMYIIFWIFYVIIAIFVCFKLIF